MKRNRLLASTLTLSFFLLFFSLWLYVHFANQSLWEKRQKKIAQYQKKAKASLQKATSSEKLEKKYSLTQKLAQDLPLHIQREIELALGKYLEAKSHLDQAFLLDSENHQLKKRLFEVEREIGLLALQARIYPLSRVSFERIKLLGWKKRAKAFLGVMKKQKNFRIKAEIKRIDEIMRRLSKEPPESGKLEEYSMEIARMRGSHIAQKLLPYLKKKSFWQRRLAIQALGKGRYLQKDVGEWLMERLQKIKNSKRIEGDYRIEAGDLIWALGWLRYKKANRLVFDVRVKVGQDTTFWSHTKIPYSWIPEEGQAPQTAEEWNQQGMMKYTKGKYGQAISDYSRALKLNPKYATAYTNRGNAYEKKEEYNLAIFDYSRALKLDPNDATTYTDRGLAYAKKGEYDRAISDYTQALKLNPRFALAYNNRGLAYYKKRNYDRAISDYTQALKLNPNDAEAYLNRGIAYVKKGNYERVAPDFRRFLKLLPHAPQAAKIRVWLRKHEKRR